MPVPLNPRKPEASLPGAALEAVKLLEATLLQSAIVELSHAAQREAAPEELKHLHREFEASLTDSQRQQLASGGGSAELLTPAQVEILRQMEPYLQGLTPEQVRSLGLQEGIREAQERYRRLHGAGPEPANETILPYAVGLLLLLMTALILLMLRAC